MHQFERPMKINQLRVTIETGRFPGHKQARIEVIANGVSHAMEMDIPEDDFESAFDWFMGNAKRIILEKVRAK
jgi:antibiotic biosynthesis monooxygenase (ABM) superfamily enzyme